MSAANGYQVSDSVRACSGGEVNEVEWFQHLVLYSGRGIDLACNLLNNLSGPNCSPLGCEFLSQLFLALQVFG